MHEIAWWSFTNKLQFNDHFVWAVEFDTENTCPMMLIGYEKDNEVQVANKMPCHSTWDFMF